QPLGRIFGVVADISQVEGARQFFVAVDGEFDALDILVNNAGQGLFKKVGDMTPAEWHLNIDLNLNGAFYCAHEALARFATRGGGFIVNISSLAARNAFSGGAGYNAAKFGLNGFTEALMLDHRHDNVRVSSIMPGSVDTEFSGTSGKPKSADTSWMIAPEDVAEAVSMVLRLTARPMGRMNQQLIPAQTGLEAEKLDADLHKRIVGQDEAIQQIISVYQTHLAGMSSPGRPIGNLLFLGPTGSGKTRLVEATAESLVGDPRAVIKIDCAEFQHSHEIAKLIGSPPGYLGHRETH